MIFIVYPNSFLYLHDYIIMNIIMSAQHELRNSLTFHSSRECLIPAFGVIGKTISEFLLC